VDAKIPGLDDGLKLRAPLAGEAVAHAERVFFDSFHKFFSRSLMMFERMTCRICHRWHILQ